MVLTMPNTTRRVDYMYVTAPNRPGEAARVLEALRAGAINLLVFSGFPEGRGKSQIDVVTDDIDALKAVAKKHKWKLSKVKRALLVQGTDEMGAALEPLTKLAGAKVNVTATDAVAAGDGRYGMIIWVEPRSYRRAAKILGAN